MAEPIGSQSPQNPLKREELHLIDAWWRACNYLSVGMIYLKDNQRRPSGKDVVASGYFSPGNAGPSI